MTKSLIKKAKLELLEVMFDLATGPENEMGEMERKRLKHLTAPESKTVLITEQNQSYKSFRSMSKKHESQLREFPMAKWE